jgi:zinc-ribbon domain
MTAFCTRCGAKLDPESRHCTQCGSAIAPASEPIAASDPLVPTAKKNRRWLWWLAALILFFALGFWLARLLAPKCPSCPSLADDGAGSGRTARAAGSTDPESGPPDKLGNGASGEGPAEAAGGSSTGQIDGAGKIIPHDFAGKEDTGNSTVGRKSQDGDPGPEPAPTPVGGDPELFGAVAQLAQGVAPYGAAANTSQNNPFPRTKSLVAYDFTYDKTNIPRYQDNVRNVASSISYALDLKTGEHTGAYGTGAGIVTTSSFDEVVGWYRKNLPAGWQSSSIGDFGQLAQQATQGPGGDLIKLFKGEMPGASSTRSIANPPAPKVRVALFKAPTAGIGPADSTIMIIQKDDKPVSVYLQSQVK